ncbi:MAG: STAS domain-containing protein [Brachymonas sp.]|nr:STAS domain-containing protein [Brachymonas sp.]
MTICRLTLPESIGHARAGALLQSLQAQLKACVGKGGLERIEVDAAALQQFDSSALALLLALLRAARQQGCAWVLRHPSARLAGLAALYGVDALLLADAAAANVMSQ